MAAQCKRVRFKEAKIINLMLMDAIWCPDRVPFF